MCVCVWVCICPLKYVFNRVNIKREELRALPCHGYNLLNALFCYIADLQWQTINASGCGCVSECEGVCGLHKNTLSEIYKGGSDEKIADIKKGRAPTENIETGEKNTLNHYQKLFVGHSCSSLPPLLCLFSSLRLQVTWNTCSQFPSQESEYEGLIRRRAEWVSWPHMTAAQSGPVPIQPLQTQALNTHTVRVWKQRGGSDYTQM